MKNKWKIAIELLLIYIFCANTYVGIEIVYRNFSDRSMWILAGFIGIFAYEINNTILSYDVDYLIQCGMMTIIATLFEGICGHIVNWNYQIWDYRDLPFSFWDAQCNLYFCIAWFIIMFIVIAMLDVIDWKMFNGEKPHYIILGRRINIL